MTFWSSFIMTKQKGGATAKAKGLLQHNIREHVSHTEENKSLLLAGASCFTNNQTCAGSQNVQMVHIEIFNVWEFSGLCLYQHRSRCYFELIGDTKAFQSYDNRAQEGKISDFPLFIFSSVSMCSQGSRAADFSLSYALPTYGASHTLQWLSLWTFSWNVLLTIPCFSLALLPGH